MATDKNRDRLRLDRQRERREASNPPIPYEGRENEPGQQLAGHDPAPYTGRAESPDMAVEIDDIAAPPIPRQTTTTEGAAMGLTDEGRLEGYELAGPPAAMRTTGEKLGLDEESPGEIHDPASAGVGPISNFLFGVIALLVIIAVVYLLYQNL